MPANAGPRGTDRSRSRRDLASKMPEQSTPRVHVVMGGEDVDDWFLYPERPAIIIGTQDMLLSRAHSTGAMPAPGRDGRWNLAFFLMMPCG